MKRKAKRIRNCGLADVEAAIADGRQLYALNPQRGWIPVASVCVARRQLEHFKATRARGLWAAWCHSYGVEA